MFNQIKFFSFIFNNKQYLNIRPCQNLQSIIQYCQLRNYISIVKKNYDLLIRKIEVCFF
jgi:hypothetical protein